MKKFFLVSIFLFNFAAAQEKNTLSSLFKVEAFFDKISFGYEMPLDKKFLLDISAGVGGANVIGNGDNSYKLGDGYFGQFAKAQLRYYISRERRIDHNHSLTNNSGSFLAFQSKFNLNGDKKYIGKVWMNDLTFGQQLPVGNKFLFKYNAGLGYGYNLDFNDGNVYPAVNISFGYVF